MHLVEFQLEDRQLIDRDCFKAYWESLNGSTLPLNHPTIRVNAEIPVNTGAGTGVRDFLFDTHGGTVFPGEPSQPVPPSPSRLLKNSPRCAGHKDLDCGGSDAALDSLGFQGSPIQSGVALRLPPHCYVNVQSD